MSWLIENFYIVAVIGFFIISALGKRGKNAEDGKNPVCHPSAAKGTVLQDRGSSGHSGLKQDGYRPLRKSPVRHLFRKAPGSTGSMRKKRIPETDILLSIKRLTE